MKKNILYLCDCLLIVIMVLALLPGCTPKDHAKKQPEATPAISVAKPIIQDIVLHKSYPGYLTSEQTVDLVGRVNGYLQAIKYTPGAYVKKGDLLFVIEPTQYRDAVQQSEAGVKTAEAQLNYAQNNYVRMKEAMQSDAISEIDLIQAESNLNAAISSLKNAKAQLETTRTNLSYCYITAPFSGRVSKNNYDVGNYINGTAQAPTLATIYKDDKMFVYFNIEDNQYLKMIAISKGENLPKEVYINTQDNILNQYTGKLDYLSPNIELSTGTLNIRAQIDNPKGELKSGLYVTIDLPYGEQKNAVLIQDASIGSDQLGKFIYIVNDSNIVKYRHIEVGEVISDTLRQVLSGLKANERYVTQALLKVRNGMKIDPKESK